MTELNTLNLIDILSRKNCIQINLYTYMDTGEQLSDILTNEGPTLFLIQPYASWAFEISLPQLEGDC
jgi:hypothetical protein